MPDETAPTQIPTKTPTREPDPERERRIDPARICPEQRERLVREIAPLLP